MNLQKLPQAFSICQISDVSQIDFAQPYVFLSKTDEEISLVCETGAVPPNTLAREDGWRALRVQGVLEFSLVGILASFSTILAQAGISIFAVSTYLTDYLFIKEYVFARACAVLSGAGYAILE
jgi:hypothetical protein